MENIDSLGIFAFLLLFGWTVHLAPAFIIRFLLLKRQSTITLTILICVAHIFVITAIRAAFSSKMNGGDHLATFLYFIILRFNESSADFIKNNKLIISISYVVLIAMIGFIFHNIRDDYVQLASNHIDDGENKFLENNKVQEYVQPYGERLLDYYIKKHDSWNEEWKDPERLARYSYDKSSDKNTMDYESWKIFHGVDKFIQDANQILASKNAQSQHQDTHQSDPSAIGFREQQWTAAQEKFFQANPEFANGDLNRVYTEEVNHIITTPQAERMSDDDVLNLAKTNVVNRDSKKDETHHAELLKKQWIAAQEKFFEQNPEYLSDDLYQKYAEEINKIVANPESNSLTNEDVLILAKSKLDGMLAEHASAPKKSDSTRRERKLRVDCGEGFVSTPEGGCKPQ